MGSGRWFSSTRRFHRLCLQFLQAEDCAGLAQPWRVQCFRPGALYGDVRLSPDDLSAFRLASDFRT